MAKQRKLLYPASPNSFFDEMEEEMNNSKRKMCRKANPLPPEKLFLQFDPSKKITVSSSKNEFNSQPLLVRKNQWKPPIKALSQSEHFDSCNNMAFNVIEQITSAKSNDSEAKLISSNNYNTEIISLCLEENIPKIVKSAEDKENADVIIINSSQESSEHRLTQSVSNCYGQNSSEDSNGTSEETMLSQYAQTQHDEKTVDSTHQKEDNAILEDCVERLASEANLNFEITKQIIPSKNTTFCQDLNTNSHEGEYIREISKLGDENSNESSYGMDDGKLSAEEETFHKKLNTEIEQTNNKLNPIQYNEHFKHNNVLQLTLVSEMEPLQPDVASKAGKTDESKIINESSIHKNGISCGVESSKNHSNKIQVLNKNCEIDVIQIDSVLENSCPTEIHDSPKLEEERESNEYNELDLNVYSSAVTSEHSCITNVDCAKEYSKAILVNNQNNSLVGIVIDNSDIVDEHSEQLEINPGSRAFKTAERGRNSAGGDEINVNKEEPHLNSDISLCEVEKIEKNESTHELEQLLEIEKKISEEKIEMDEEYSCMISSSQLLEIEKNYYESSECTVANKVFKESDNDCLKSNENKMIESNSNKNEVKFKSYNIISNQTESAQQNHSSTIFQKIPKVQWPKNLLEMQTKLRELTKEINSLNALLVGVTRDIWPQRHRDNYSA